MMKQDPGGLTTGAQLTGKPVKQQIIGKIQTVLQKRLRPLSCFKSIPCATPVWEVLFNDFHQPFGHPSPKSKIKPYNTGISCYLFLQVIFLISTCRPKPNLKKYFIFKLEIGIIQYLRRAK